MPVRAAVAARRMPTRAPRPRRPPPPGAPPASGAGLAAAPLIDFDRRDELQRVHLAAAGIDPDAPPRHYVPASNDFAEAVKLGLGWGMLPRIQCETELAAGALVLLAGDPIDVPLYWQQWNLASPLLDAVAAAVVAEARAVLR